MPNIAIVWDFDGTLTPMDSTTKVVEILHGDQEQPVWEHVLAMDAPIWMHALSRIAARKRVPLNSEFFRTFGRNDEDAVALRDIQRFFRDKSHSVNRRVGDADRWAPFENIVYIGDDDTDGPIRGQRTSEEYEA